jgi:hypothetical protein
MTKHLSPDQVDASVYGPLTRRELAELVTWLDDVAMTASLAVPVAARRPGASVTGLAAEMHELAGRTAAWQARTA